MAKTQVKSLEEYLKEWWQQHKGAYDEQVSLANAQGESQISQARDEYKQEYRTAHKDYAKSDIKTAVQGYTDNQKINEKTARLGLDDSGYAQSAKRASVGKIQNERQQLVNAKQQRVDTAETQLKVRENEINAKTQESLQELKEKYDKQASDYATASHKADTAAAAKEYEAEQKALAAAQKAAQTKTATTKTTTKKTQTKTQETEQQDSDVSYTFTGAHDRNGYMIFRDNSGKDHSFGVGVNPYTGDRNFYGDYQDGEWVINVGWYDLYENTKDDAKAGVIKYGVFQNGYQPRGVVLDGKDYGYLKAHTTLYENQSPSGKKQTVWLSTKGGKKYWMWQGSKNRYVEVEKLSDGSWKIK